MISRTLTTSVLLGLACIATARTAEAAPAWCNTPGLGDKIGTSNSDVARALEKKSSIALPALVRATCFPDNDARERMREIDAARAAWSTKLGMTEDDWKDVAAWAAEGGMSMIIYDHELVVGDVTKNHAISTLAPWQQFAAILNGAPSATDSSRGGSSYGASLYVADALGPALSESGRLAVLEQCTDGRRGAIELVQCDAEIQRLDRKKLLAEIRADRTASGKMKTILRIKLMQLAKRLEGYAAKVTELKASQPDADQMFAIGAATRSDWDTIWKAEPELLQFALAMDDARQTASRTLREGCTDKAWRMWDAQVAKIPASKFAGFDERDWAVRALSAITSTPTGYLAAVALFSCEYANRTKDPMISAIGDAMQNVPGLRGPRLATHWAIVNAGVLDTSVKGALPNAGQDWATGSDLTGVFATVRKVGAIDANGTALVTFAEKTEKQERCVRTKPTKRISRILDDGSIVYGVDCLKWGVVTVDKTPEPLRVHKRYLTHVKPKTIVYMTWSGGVLAGVFPKGKRNPVAVFGVAVK